jgi:phenylalanyl-tRNA synthetase alpha chain
MFYSHTRRFYSVSKKATSALLDTEYETDENYNLSPSIISKMGRKLHLVEYHPLNLIKTQLQKELSKQSFKHYDNLNPIVTTEQNFDHLLIPSDHPGRSPFDSYYINKNQMLRTHTSAHQRECLEEFAKHAKDHSGFTITADVYRRDTIDSTHYPVFHQMEGVKLFPSTVTLSNTPSFKVQHEHQAFPLAINYVVDDLKKTLQNLVSSLFGNVEYRWVDAYFPFTHPSFELEIYFNGDWLEILGCGVMKQSIIDSTPNKSQIGWACGLGLERWAMILFGIPDIRLFWCNDQRFLLQFKDNGVKTRYKPISKFPPTHRDISFFVPNQVQFNENSLMDLVRNVGGDLIESVEKVDEFTHPKSGLQSLCYRITFRSMTR